MSAFPVRTPIARRLRGLTAYIAAAGAALAALSAASAGAAPAPPLSGPDVIAFAAAESGGDGAVPHLWLMDAGTGARQRLTGGRYADDQPSWSPDGRRLVFADTRKVRVPGLRAPQITPLIAVMTLSTRSVRTITTGSAFDEAPAWSPDGRRIAFSRTSMSGPATNYPQIWTMDTTGRRLRRLTRGSAGDLSPAWSPDGRLIAFARQRRSSLDRPDIWVMRSDGSHQRRIATNATHPAWSPDGTRIAFGRPKRTTAGECCARDLYVMNADGSNRRLVVRDGNQPSWSPDGARIAFTTLAVKPPQIGVVAADGGGSQRLTGFGGDAYGPEWRPAAGTRTRPGQNE